MARTTFSRQDLLPTLADVFRRRGFEGATLSELARVTGLGKASLYHHFPGGKVEMADALTRHAIAELDARAFRHLDGSAPWRDRLDAFIDGFADYADDGKSNCLLAVLALTGERSSLEEVIGGQIREWLKRLADAFAESGLSDKAARRRARELLVALQGGLVMARLLGGTKAFSQTVKRLHKDLRSGGDLRGGGEDEPDASAAQERV
jgi:AcrR family transcriptional regulator